MYLGILLKKINFMNLQSTESTSAASTISDPTARLTRALVQSLEKMSQIDLPMQVSMLYSPRMLSLETSARELLASIHCSFTEFLKMHVKSGLITIQKKLKIGPCIVSFDLSRAPISARSKVEVEEPSQLSTMIIQADETQSVVTRSRKFILDPKCKHTFRTGARNHNKGDGFGSYHNVFCIKCEGISHRSKSFSVNQRKTKIILKKQILRLSSHVTRLIHCSRRDTKNTNVIQKRRNNPDPSSIFPKIQDLPPNIVFNIGEVVQASNKNLGGKYYLATILNVIGNDGYRVSFNTGEKLFVSRGSIRKENLRFTLPSCRDKIVKARTPAIKNRRRK